MSNPPTKKLPPVTLNINRVRGRGVVITEKRLNENLTAEEAGKFAQPSLWPARDNSWFAGGILVNWSIAFAFIVPFATIGVHESPALQEEFFAWVIASVVAVLALPVVLTLNYRHNRALKRRGKAAADLAAAHLDAMPHRTDGWEPPGFRDLYTQLQKERDRAAYTPEREALIFQALAALGAYRRLADPDPVGKRISEFAAKDSDPAVIAVAREYRANQKALALARTAAEVAVDRFRREIEKDQVTAEARRRVAATTARDTEKGRVIA